MGKYKPKRDKRKKARKKRGTKNHQTAKQAYENGLSALDKALKRRGR